MNKDFIYNQRFLEIAKKTKRIRIYEDRNLKKGIRLNRNERVLDFPKNIFINIFKNVKQYDLGKYPEQSKIYKHLAKFENLNVTSEGGGRGQTHISSNLRLTYTKSPFDAIIQDTVWN